jgi:Domain of Unknown Function (DUF1080)
LAIPYGKPLHRTGATYNFAAPSNATASRPVGHWNTFGIEATSQKYSVALNDVKVISEFTGSRRIEGYIGIQNHDIDSHISFKNIKIKETKV